MTQNNRQNKSLKTFIFLNNPYAVPFLNMKYKNWNCGHNSKSSCNRDILKLPLGLEWNSNPGSEPEICSETESCSESESNSDMESDASEQEPDSDWEIYNEDLFEYPETDCE
jgi:hypothetical protein